MNRLAILLSLILFCGYAQFGIAQNNDKQEGKSPPNNSRQPGAKQRPGQSGQQSGRRRGGQRGGQRGQRGGRGADNSLATGEVAPDFTLDSLDGKSKTQLSAFKGKKPVVLIFGSYT